VSISGVAVSYSVFKWCFSGVTVSISGVTVSISGVTVCSQ
jgi:hypothetical protein